MAIARVNIPTPTAPVGVADYQAQLDQITALNQAFTGRNPVDGSTIRAGTVMMVGSVLYKSTTDTAITGTPSLYVKIIPSGATASASFVASLSGVSWNHAYGGYYDGSGNLYLFDEDLALAIGAITGSPMTLVGQPRVPVGSVTAWSVAAIPSGWLECKGDSILRSSAPRLFAIIGTTYGSVDGTHFTLPDLRSASIRGVGTPTRFADATAVTLNQTIDDKMQTHDHSIYNWKQVAFFTTAPTPSTTNTGDGDFPVDRTGSNSGRSGNETTGKAVGMYYIIKA